MASRWRSSGAKGAGRKVDLETGIGAQNTIPGDEDTCAELGRLVMATARRARCPPDRGGLRRYFAFVSTWKMPNVLPSGSMKYPCQQVFGTANFGSATIPPSCSIVFAVASKFPTSTEHTNALVPHSGGGVLAGRLSNPPLDPPVSILQ